MDSNLWNRLRKCASYQAFLTGVTLALIVVVGFSLRFVNFDEWLYFKLDQARDAMLISDAVEKGPAYLPLLGQRVGAVDLEKGLLRVGPIYYYFQYLSGVMFDSVEPWVFAYPDLVFGVLAIPMLFLVARLAFSVPTSLCVSALLSVSFFGVEYSRFAWNPNPLPFFFLLATYGMIRFLSEPQGERKYVFLILWAIAFGVGIQLHFFGMTSLCGVTGAFILWKFKLWRASALRALLEKSALLSISKYAAIFAGVLCILSVPIFANEVIRGGENTRNFIEALTKKQDTQLISDRIGEALSENGRYWCLIVTSECLTESSKKNRWPIVLTGVFLVAGFSAAFMRARSMPEGKGKDMLHLLFIWSAVFFVLSIPVAFQLRPRFFLVVLPVPFLLFGAVFEMLLNWRKSYGFTVGLVIFLGMAFLNIRGISAWFSEQMTSQAGDVPVFRTVILKNKDGVTLGQLRRAADIIESKMNVGDRLYFYVKPEHIAPLEYLFEQKQKVDPGFIFESMKMNVDPKARFFAIIPTEQIEAQAVANKFGEPFAIRSFDVVGQIAVAELDFSGRRIDLDFHFQRKSPKDANVLWLDGKQRSSDRVFWGDVFFGKTAKSSLSTEDGVAENESGDESVDSEK